MSGNKTNQLATNIADMKESIKQAGGLFYQYRACNRDAATIYDIENIRHGVAYARTPLYMNDPFDSMIGFSAEKVYQNAIDMIVSSMEASEEVKLVISALLKHRALGQLATLLQQINDIKKYLYSKRASMHKAMLSLGDFFAQYKQLLYTKMPNSLKKTITPALFVAYASVLVLLGEYDVSEENIINMLKLEDIIDSFHIQAEKLRDETYVPALRNFLSQLTISCFSVSGWKNQLMWAHYANSYKGMCVEYDFNEINEFIGFIYPVNYTTERPTLSLQDVGIAGFNLKEKTTVSSGETNVIKLFEYLLAKNTCWSYEEEWRVINIGQAYTPLFINLPCIKSITLGVGIDELCKRLILDVCAEKGIPCFELVIDKERFNLDRIPISSADIPFDVDEEIGYINMIAEQANITNEKINKAGETLAAGAKILRFDTDACKTILSSLKDHLCAAYFMKMSFTRIFNHVDDSETVDIPSEIIDAAIMLNANLSENETTIKENKELFHKWHIQGFIKERDYQSLCHQVDSIEELINKISKYPWHPTILRLLENNQSKEN